MFEIYGRRFLVSAPFSTRTNGKDIFEIIDFFFKEEELIVD
jgi:hypothetical protein